MFKPREPAFKQFKCPRPQCVKNFDFWIINSFLKNRQICLRQMQVISLSGKYILIICINFEVIFTMNYSLIAWWRFAAIFTATLAHILQEPVMNFENYASCFLQSIQPKTKRNVFLKSNLCSTLSHPVHIISGGWLAAAMKSLKHDMKHVVATVMQYISIPTDVSCVSSGSYVITVYSVCGVDFFFTWYPVPICCFSDLQFFLPIMVVCYSLAAIGNGIQTTFLTAVFYRPIHKLVSVLLGDSTFQMQIISLVLRVL